MTHRSQAVGHTVTEVRVLFVQPQQQISDRHGEWGGRRPVLTPESHTHALSLDTSLGPARVRHEGRLSASVQQGEQGPPSLCGTDVFLQLGATLTPGDRVPCCSASTPHLAVCISHPKHLPHRGYLVSSSSSQRGLQISCR